jgi:hypothetical protein
MPSDAERLAWYNDHFGLIDQDPYRLERGEHSFWVEEEEDGGWYNKSGRFYPSLDAAIDAAMILYGRGEE